LDLKVYDAAGNEAVRTVQVAIDNTAPAPPQSVVVDGGDGWKNVNSFRVLWSNPNETGRAPVAGADFEICSVAKGSCTRGSRSGTDLDSIDDLTVPAAGDYVLNLWLRDAAGNEDRRLAAPPVHLRFDNIAPRLAFRPQVVADPTLIGVDVEDEPAGVAGGTIEGKRPADKAWRPLETKLVGDQLVGRIDDENLPDGPYQLRARVVDRAGNERSSDGVSDGRAAKVVMLPLRLKTRLVVGVMRPGAGRRSQRRSQVTVGFGGRSTVTGQLRSYDGSPLADTVVSVFEQARSPGAVLVPVANLKTSSTGRFTYRAAPGVSRVLRFRYEGTATVRSAQTEFALAVSASSTFRLSRRRIVNGESVRIAGRVRGRSMLSEGKLIEIQAVARGRWRTFATTRTNPAGFWQHDYRFDGTRGNVRYRLRARIPPEAGFPYASGHSGEASVLVRGL